MTSFVAFAVDINGTALARYDLAATEMEAAEKEAQQFLETSATEHGGDPLKCWTDFCHVLLNSNEFLYID